MRTILIAVAALTCCLGAPAANAVASDAQFTQAMYDYVAAKKNEFLAPIVAAGKIPSPEQSGEAYCRAVMWWKMSNPGGEEKLTLAGLISLRRMEVLCGHRMRRAPVQPGEPQQAPPTLVTIPTSGTEDRDGANEAVEDFRRWHPEEASQPSGQDTPPESEPGGEPKQPAPDPPPGFSRDPYRGGLVPLPPPGFSRDPYRGGLVPLPPPGFKRDPYRGGLVRDRDFGSVDPLDEERWQKARRPIAIGKNDEVGSGARRREQATGAALGILGGALGLGGRGGSGPKLARCRFNERSMTRLENGGVELGLLAQRKGDDIILFADISRSPDSGTFQAALLQDQHGQMLTPADAGICELYGEWRLSVSWTSTTYQDGRQIAQDSGGWSKAGSFGLPGLGDQAAGAPDGLWKRLGFSNASHGVKRIMLTFRLPRDQLLRDGAVLLAHVSRPSGDPVTTAPFAVMLEETPEGIVLARCP